MHRNRILPKPWFRTEYFLKQITTVLIKTFYDLECCLPTKFND